MHSAVITRDENRVRELLQLCEKGLLEFADVEGPDEDGYTPLQYACILREHGVLKLLHEASADVTATDKKGFCPLHWAAMQLDYLALEMLCTHVFDVDIKDDRGRTPLYLACVEGRNVHGKTDIIALIRCIQCLTKLGANVNIRDDEQLTVLHFVAASWQHEAVIALTEAGADVHAVNSDGYIPLHLVCLHSPLKLAVGQAARLLSGASSGGALGYAPEELYEDAALPTLRALLEAGTSPNYKDAHGRDSLHLLALNVDLFGDDVLGAISFLLSRGARADDSQTMLMELLQKCFPEDESSITQWSHMITAAVDQWTAATVPDVNYDTSTLTLDVFARSDCKGPLAPDGTETGPCRTCQTPFTMFRRQHHCRLCSLMCCDHCSKKRIKLDTQQTPIRVCDGCFNRTCKHVMKHMQVIQVNPSSPSTSHGPIVMLTEPDRRPSTEHNKGNETAPTIATRSGAEGENRSSLFGTAKPRSQSAEETGGANTTMSVMSEARERIQQRGEKLSQLSDKSADLAKASSEFAKMAKELNNQSKW
eukprot:CAMPEP_0182417836 /NCGR_PEP_ID=MMETSP1167-20130531/2274_1 /TAXON_ID=2988 /ORGANISM="Mallomonas Sp, Strain CCMP3275" /LENGTH=535 /DNA_ID=CAMNT_0024591635 /DNA_START=275 /DNA_END=1879 /DNA_ORIENTATION=-